jgi:hemin uptake protein HemP
LSLRRPAAQALTTSRASKTSAPTATPPTERAGNAASAAPESSAGERVVRSETLLQGRSHISITHNGETYQLRATRLGKLILTK